MNLGDIVIYGGQRFYVRGFDPLGACPRYLYLENVRTGETLSVAFERNRPARENSASGLRLVQDDPSPPPTHSDPLEEESEPKPSDSNRPSPA